MATGIGDTLRSARRQHGVSLADAAAETRVRESYLAALEEEEFEALGGDVYVKGFLRSYARYLGLDPEPLVVAYRRDFEREHEPAPLVTTPVAPMSGPRQPGVAIVAGLAMVVVVVLAAIGLATGEQEGQLQPAAPPPVPQEAELEQPPASELPTEEPPVEETTAEEQPTILGDEVEVVLTVSGGQSWLRVVVDGVTQLEGLQSSGTTRTFTGDEEISLRIGNAGAVRLEVNGEDQGRLGDRGQVVERTYTVEEPA
ncbi:MAG TPA: helix-turn-helix domain-containing protein [Egibacteraceae bacterium]|nr:helix-turn-helix domain-containing protein [Egibacteraceae bacterium]